MNAPPVPALVVAVEAVLDTKVRSLRYLPSPDAAAQALAGKASGQPGPGPRLALDYLDADFSPEP